VKVVLFCGGLGMRLRTDGRSLPKPMTPIGSRPVLWHIMRYYAHFGHREFILCLGYGAGAVKEYFLNYRETASNDFVLRDGTRVELLSTDLTGWQITFVDTGWDTPIGERLRRVRDHLGGEEIFLANYGDVLTDAPMNEMIEEFRATPCVAQLLTVRPQDSFHVVHTGPDGLVTGLTAITDMSMRINGGYFVFRQSLFDHLGEGEDLVTHAFGRAAARGLVRAYPYDGFWAPMDTLKERAALEDLDRHGQRPWAVWQPDQDRRHGRVTAIDVATLE